MRARVWGCRGSLATPGPATVRYGGNTSCVEVRPPDGSLIVLDAGTGIRSLGLSLAAAPVRELDLLLTHVHLDHIEGIGFFQPLFDPECTVRIWGPRPDGTSLEEHISTWLSPPFFPVPFDRIPAQVEFTEIWDDAWELDGLRIASAPVSHPGPTVGYRVSQNGASIAYVPDNEPGLDPEAGMTVAAGADLLFHDAQYTDSEYASRTGWGHCSLSDFSAYLGTARPRRAVMFHHDPTHGDGRLEEMLETASASSDCEHLALGHEGLEIQLP
ncbi:MAG: MBL fold metallo-hydrolase [Gaiellaceae bacterium]